MALIDSCIRCGKGRWAGVAPVCSNCRDAYADEVRQAAMRLTTEYLAHPANTLADLKPCFIDLIEALDGVYQGAHRPPSPAVQPQGGQYESDL